MQVDGLGDGVLTVNIRMSNEELGVALKAFQEPLIRVRFGRSAALVLSELCGTVYRQSVEYSLVDARVRRANHLD